MKLEGFNLVVSVGLGKENLKESKDGQYVRFDWSPDDLNNTTLSIVDPELDSSQYIDETGGEIFLEIEDYIVLGIPSGELSGQIKDIVIMPDEHVEGNDIIIDGYDIKFKLKDCLWEGKWLGFSKGRSGLFNWRHFSIYRQNTTVDSSISNEIISLSDYKMARNLARHVTIDKEYELDKSDWQNLLKESLKVIQDFEKRL